MRSTSRGQIKTNYALQKRKSLNDYHGAASVALLGKYRGSCQLAVGQHNNWAEGKKKKKKKGFALGIFTWV